MPIDTMVPPRPVLGMPIDTMVPPRRVLGMPIGIMCRRGWLAALLGTMMPP